MLRRHLRSKLTLVAAAFVLPLTYLFISAAFQVNVGRWTLRVYTPPVLGYASVYRITDHGFIQLPPLETVSTPSGDFCTSLECPLLEKADLRILIPRRDSTSGAIRVFAQFFSKDGRYRIDLSPAFIPTYSEKKFYIEAKDDSLAALKLPRLSVLPITLPPLAARSMYLYWLLCVACTLSGLLYFISIKTGSGDTWISQITKTPMVGRWKRIFVKHSLPFLILVNLGLFLLIALLFSQRYPVADDPMMSMIASGILGSKPSEHLVFINVAIGFLLKTLSSMAPSAPWYYLFIASLLVSSSAVIGLSLVKALGFKRGVIRYTIAFTFFIFESFYQLQFTIAAALVCLAGLSLALSTAFHAKSNYHVSLPALLLILLGSLVRHDSALMVITLAAPAVLVQSVLKRRGSVLILLVLSLVGIIALRYLDQIYYSASPDWKFFCEYNIERGRLHGTSRFNAYDDNRDIYSKVGWNENDFYMISQDWLYQDLAVFSKNKLTYLSNHLCPPQSLVPTYYALLRPSYTYFWMPLVILAFLLYNVFTKTLRLSLVAGILFPLIGALYYLARESHLPDHVFIPAMIETFLLIQFLSDSQKNTRGNTTFWLSFFVSLGLFLVSLEFLFSWETSGFNKRRTIELNRALDKIDFLDNKIFQISITSIRYEDLPPFENDNRMKSLNFIDGLWSYPSPDTLSVYQKNGIKKPLFDLALNDNFYLLIPTGSWNRGDEVQKFLHDHYQLNTSYEVVTDPDGNSCCYPPFTVLKFHTTSTSPNSH